EAAPASVAPRRRASPRGSKRRNRRWEWLDAACFGDPPRARPCQLRPRTAARAAAGRVDAGRAAHGRARAGRGRSADAAADGAAGPDRRAAAPLRGARGRSFRSAAARPADRRRQPGGRSAAMKPVRTAVFPVAGLGTRILPATKAMPKEMLTVVDKPLIQYAIEEAREAGIERFVFVTGRGKGAIEDHF